MYPHITNHNDQKYCGDVRITDSNTLRIVKEEAGYARCEIESILSRGFKGGNIGKEGRAFVMCMCMCMCQDTKARGVTQTMKGSPMTNPTHPLNDQKQSNPTPQKSTHTPNPNTDTTIPTPIHPPIPIPIPIPTPTGKPGQMGINVVGGNFFYSSKPYGVINGIDFGCVFVLHAYFMYGVVE